MRDIKFRAWEKMTNMGKTGSMSYDQEFCLNHILHPDGLVIMQYTGLKDKNGVEVYEGDIVSCINMLDYDLFSDPENKVVEYKDGGFEPMISKKMTKYRILPKYYSFEVIGNIYENKELL